MPTGTSIGLHITRPIVSLTTRTSAPNNADPGSKLAGLIGFVGLVIPHMLRLIIGNDYAYLLPGPVYTPPPSR